MNNTTFLQSESNKKSTYTNEQWWQLYDKEVLLTKKEKSETICGCLDLECPYCLNSNFYPIEDVINKRPVKNIHKKVIAEKYLPIVDVDTLESRITLIKSACGTGKNFTLVKTVAEILARNGRVVIIVPRVSLSYAGHKQYGVPFYQDNKERIIKGSCAICLDSIRKLDLKEKIDLLIIDEAAQQAHHSFGGTLHGKKIIIEVNEFLQNLIAETEKIIFQDADLDWHTITHCIWWAKHIDCSFKKNCQLLWNIRSPMVPTVFAKFDEVGRPRKLPCKSAPKALLAQYNDIKDAITEGQKLFVYTTTRKDAQIVRHLIAEDFPNLRIALCTSLTSSDKLIRQCFKEARLFAENFDCVVASPTAETGISLEEENTWRVFGWISTYEYGNYSPNAMNVYQGLSRVRSPIGNRWDVYFHGTCKQKILFDEDHIELNERQVIDSFYRDTKDIKIRSAKLGGIPISEFPEKYNVKEQPIIMVGNEYHYRDTVLKGRNYKFGGNLGDRFTKKKNQTIAKGKKKEIECYEIGSFQMLCQSKKIPYVATMEYDLTNDEAISFMDRHNYIADNIKMNEDLDIVNAEIIGTEEYESLKDNPDASDPKIMSKLYNYEIRKFYGLKSLIIDDIRHFRSGGKYRAMQFTHVSLMMAGEKHAVYAIDARAMGKWSGYRNDYGDRTLLRIELWKHLGIENFEEAVEKKQILREDLCEYLTDEKIKELQRYKLPHSKNPAMIRRDLAKGSDIILGMTQKAGKRYYYIASIEGIKKRAENYRSRLENPKDFNDFEDLLIDENDKHEEFQEIDW